MAKVVGPLYSQQASGHIAKAVVFSRLGGQNVVRGYTVQPETITDEQVLVRIAFAVAGKINEAIRKDNWRYNSETETIIEWASRDLRLGEVWSSRLTRLSVGIKRAFYIETVALYAVVDDRTRGRWEGYADFLPFTTQDYIRNETTTTRGFMLFLNQRMLGENGYGPGFSDRAAQGISRG